MQLQEQKHRDLQRAEQDVLTIRHDNGGPRSRSPPPPPPPPQQDLQQLQERVLLLQQQQLQKQHLQEALLQLQEQKHRDLRRAEQDVLMYCQDILTINNLMNILDPGNDFIFLMAGTFIIALCDQ